MEKQGLHIDFKVAKQAFESYLDEYDREDDKIQLKIVHLLCSGCRRGDCYPDASERGRRSAGQDHWLAS